MACVKLVLNVCQPLSQMCLSQMIKEALQKCLWLNVEANLFSARCFTEQWRSRAEWLTVTVFCSVSETQTNRVINDISAIVLRVVTHRCYSIEVIMCELFFPLTTCKSLHECVVAVSMSTLIHGLIHETRHWHSANSVSSAASLALACLILASVSWSCHPSTTTLWICSGLFCLASVWPKPVLRIKAWI